MKRDVAGFVDCSGMRACVVVIGDDAAKFLHGQCTQEIKALESGRGGHAFVLTPKGKIVGDFRVLRLEASFYLFTDCAQRDTIETHFKRYVIMQKVEFKHAEIASIFFIGEAGQALLRTYLQGESETAPPLEKNEGRFCKEESILVRWDRYQDTDYELVLPDDGKTLALKRLRELAARFHIDEWNADQLEDYRIGQGVPLFGKDYTEDNLPQETGLHECLNFTKGCYTGQEVVARLHYRGHVTQCLSWIEFEDAHFDPQQMKTLCFSTSDKRVGPMTSFCKTKNGLWQGFIYLPYLFLKTPNQLVIDGTAREIPVMKKIEIV